MKRRGPDKRGSNLDRRARKMALGKRHNWRCVHCDTQLTYATLQCDRIVPGGSYRWTMPGCNPQASCEDCNRSRGNDPTWQYVPA